MAESCTAPKSQKAAEKPLWYCKPSSATLAQPAGIACGFYRCESREDPRRHSFPLRPVSAASGTAGLGTPLTSCVVPGHQIGKRFTRLFRPKPETWIKNTGSTKAIRHSLEQIQRQTQLSMKKELTWLFLS